MDQALSIYFLLGWLGGDLLNLIGSFLADQLPLQVPGRADSQTPQLRGGGRSWERLYPALGARDTSAQGVPSLPSEMLPSPILGLLPFPPWVWSRHAPSFPRGDAPCFPFSLRDAPFFTPRVTPFSSSGAVPFSTPRHPSLLGLVSSPPQDTLFFPGAPGEQGTSLWDHANPPGPRGCPQHVPSPQVYTAIYYVLADVGMLSLYCYYRVKNRGRACELGQGWGLCSPARWEQRGGIPGARRDYRHSYRIACWVVGLVFFSPWVD